MVGDADHGAGEDGVGGNDIGAIDPDVAGFQAGGAARGNFHGWMFLESGGVRHVAILNARDGRATGRLKLRSTMGPMGPVPHKQTNTQNRTAEAAVST